MRENAVSYRMTTVACYVGNMVATIVINPTPVLFIPLKDQLGFSYQ